ncbi:hypothetical protein AJ79_09603 [Helicocarpus griseus UAMH5409]|uniref:Uncharacterized protein n=1 Tax=Helicocarpus griseus UAMH5409 TaxID=1447875 RepID=A0A2B7WIQ1_9EURO|nr:hypothetical protein AJ79_09603 [Helicocarpus griseus UAMH5409]
MPNPVRRDGFEFAYDRFVALPDRIERVDGADLRRMFLPKLTPEANKRLRDNYGRFIPAQLKHYGIEFAESDIQGNGTNFFKKVLLAGKCDKLPDHIEKLCLQMSAEWYDQLSLKDMAELYPDKLVERHFLDEMGEPDRNKATEILAVPLPAYSTYRAGRVRQAIDNVQGLCHETGGFANELTLFVGWSPDAVSKLARGQAELVEKERQRRQQEREQERDSLHQEYLRDAVRTKGSKKSPVGSYIIDCDEIDHQWPDESREMTLDIRETQTPYIFIADFDFGVLEGVMVLGSDEGAVLEHCALLDAEDDTASESESESETELDSEEALSDEDISGDGNGYSEGLKRKASCSSGQPLKKAKVSSSLKRNFFLRWKGRETSENVISYTAEKGTLKFEDTKFASFVGKMSMDFVGSGVPFKARKVSDIPSISNNSWSDFSETAYEYARVARWC